MCCLVVHFWWTIFWSQERTVGPTTSATIRTGARNYREDWSTRCGTLELLRRDYAYIATFRLSPHARTATGNLQAHLHHIHLPTRHSPLYRSKPHYIYWLSRIDVAGLLLCMLLFVIQGTGQRRELSVESGLTEVYSCKEWVTGSQKWSPTTVFDSFRQYLEVLHVAGGCLFLDMC